MSRALVLDTNVVLDLFVFDDPGAIALKDALRARRLRWVATEGMREELARVLDYPLLARRLAARGLGAPGVLACFDAHSERVEPAVPAPVACRDPDDQPFIDLAVAHRALLVSKDAEVLRLRKRLAPHSAEACAVVPALFLEPA
ncbi:putative toxin-antitoxin system toxin component, PIN family [Ramlibacter rhizophilus]|uniref:Putative toxin-antitoxin system toxin component, PIN family n=1 Tax=Ramlibacter rhizophilus TaxID=1781167 RepID=A0A4Z0BH89_9BURK|nr:putative toxin-antitoxin system toxin component, PIN family [Ramlibacter rhizophilus]TFY98111.1 putative toxin-antitoxin system toxin component, PIN family [Ramlibacter rhizophilus]